MTLKGIFVGLGHFFSVVKQDVEKVAPEVQSEINKIMGAAQFQVDELKSRHSVKAILDKATADIQAVTDTAAHHISLIEAERDAQVAKAQAILPALNLPVAPVA